MTSELTGSGESDGRAKRSGSELGSSFFDGGIERVPDLNG